ncbi:DUF2505 domain-containing protein [Phycicoccus sp. BSK3Z-2]|uniref:DUF2505 domain-containing protein n=1 Tax=Phycicoccus avicenniae TaxID=2828860 RepID=A0A941DBD1_9MICO|nr:DUF2505 domain-containing protein [Phycicoccus avicenniae]MBR7743882.1 DUF2505 domain-containing protein [Phycicoccus avicenniae]
MRLTRRETLAAAPAEVYATLTDPQFQKAKCAATHATSHEVDVVETGVGHRVRATRVLPSDDLPDVARSFVGDSLTVVETYDWGAAAADGSREAVVDLHVKGAPLTLKGTLRLTAEGGGTTETLDAELKANVPFVGGKIEQAASGPIGEAVDVELRMLRERLG